MKRLCLIATVLPFLLISKFSQGQTANSETPEMSLAVFHKINKKILKVNATISHTNKRYVNKLRKVEDKINKNFRRQNKTYYALKTDSIFKDIKRQYVEKANQQGYTYNGYIDTISTVWKFLESTSDNIEPLEKGKKVIESLQETFNASNNLEEFLGSRIVALEEVLKDQVIVSKVVRKQYGYLCFMAKEYSREFEEYKVLLKGKNLERKALDLLQKIPEFNKFLHERSQFADLFSLPGMEVTEANLAGMQTRASVSEIISTKMANLGDGGAMQMQQFVLTAQEEFREAGNKINEITGGNRDFELPGFRPNSQKTKAFSKRLEYGTDIQFQRQSALLPSIANVGLSVGYKISDKNIIGLGISYKLGFDNRSHFRFTHEGLGLRSFLDWKFKKQFFISGGVEMNYASSFKHIEQLRRFDVWQSSALIGISRRYQISKKIKGEMRLLYDFLYRNHLPIGQPIVYRIGYKL